MNAACYLFGCAQSTSIEFAVGLKARFRIERASISVVAACESCLLHGQAPWAAFFLEAAAGLPCIEWKYDTLVYT